MSEMTDEMWQAASRYLPESLRAATRNLAVEPHWLGQGEQFWYRRDGGAGPEYVVVTAETGERRPAFDHAALREALPPECDFGTLELLSVAAESTTVRAGAKVFRFDGTTLELLSERPNAPEESRSPDGRRVVFRREGNLWLREVESGEERRLTDTAELHFEWAKSPDQSLETIHLERRGITLPPVVLWSPDSRRLFTYQLDERRVRSVPLVQHVPEDGSHAPRLYEMRNALTGDAELPMAHQAVIDLETGEIVRHRGGPVHVTETSGLEKREAWWSADGTRVCFLDHDRYEREITLVELDATTGAERRILTEAAETFVDVNPVFGGMPNIRILDECDEVVWFSQRDGWGHLYLHDLTSGALKARISTGDWPVCDLLHLDAERRRVIFLAGSPEGSDDPYMRRICAAPLDGGTLEVLTPEAGDHSAFLREVGWADLIAESAGLGGWPAAVSPDGRHFVETHARPGALGCSLLRRCEDGRVVAELEEGRCELDLPPSERLQLTAADGETRLFGMLWTPRRVAPGQRLPVIDMNYPGPQCIQTPRGVLPPEDLPKIAMAAALTELGFAVLMMDGRGTPYRSKAFHDLCHGNLGDPGFLSDHVAGLRQLFEARPELDPARVGIIGHSAGGHAAARAILEYSEVFAAAVATAGSHEPRAYNHCWPEKWQGPLVLHSDGTSSHDVVANAPLAHRLQGALLLGHGGMDENVHPAITYRLAEALEAAGKSFDLLVTPNDDHATFKSNPYVIRQEFAFLVRHLC